MKSLLAPLVLALLATVSLAIAAPAPGERFHGHVKLFDGEAPVDSQITAVIDGEMCGTIDVTVDQNKSVYDLTTNTACNGAEVEFRWQRDHDPIWTTCTPKTDFSPDADTPLDITCGVDGEFSGTWIVQNDTSRPQRAVEVFPRVVVGQVTAGTEGCGAATVHGGSSFGPFLIQHAEIIYPDACIQPGSFVRVGMGTDCPCHSELEIERAVWLPAEPLFKANVNCDATVNAADALAGLSLASGVAQPADVCPATYNTGYSPNAFAGKWGDIDCDLKVTGLDAVAVLRLTLLLPSGIDADCQAAYGYPS
jgi:hypothetical protein